MSACTTPWRCLYVAINSAATAMLGLICLHIAHGCVYPGARYNYKNDVILRSARVSHRGHQNKQKQNNKNIAIPCAPRESLTTLLKHKNDNLSPPSPLLPPPPPLPPPAFPASKTASCIHPLLTLRGISAAAASANFFCTSLCASFTSSPRWRSASTPSHSLRLL